MDKPNMRCENELCIQHEANRFGLISRWNKTRCGLYEIDPYDSVSNPDGVRVDTCPARIRYKRYGW